MRWRRIGLQNRRVVRSLLHGRMNRVGLLNLPVRERPLLIVRLSVLLNRDGRRTSMPLRSRIVRRLTRRLRRNGMSLHVRRLSIRSPLIRLRNSSILRRSNTRRRHGQHRRSMLLRQGLLHSSTRRRLSLLRNIRRQSQLRRRSRKKRSLSKDDGSRGGLAFAGAASYREFLLVISQNGRRWNFSGSLTAACYSAVLTRIAARLRTQRAGRFSPAATIFRGPSSPIGLPSMESATSTVPSCTSGVTSPSEYTTW